MLGAWEVAVVDVGGVVGDELVDKVAVEVVDGAAVAVEVVDGLAGALVPELGEAVAVSAGVGAVVVGTAVGGAVGAVVPSIGGGLLGAGGVVSATVQTCIIHLIRNTFRYASRKYWDALAKDMRPIYTAPTAAAAKDRFDEFAEKWGKPYPAIVRLWENAWAEFIPFLDYDVEIRKVICSTNAIWVFGYARRLGLASRGDRSALALNAIDLGVLDSNCRAGRLGAGPGAWLEESLHDSTQICRRPGPAARTVTRRRRSTSSPRQPSRGSTRTNTRAPSPSCPPRASSSPASPSRSASKAWRACWRSSRAPARS